MLKESCAISEFNNSQTYLLSVLITQPDGSAYVASVAGMS